LRAAAERVIVRQTGGVGERVIYLSGETVMVGDIVPVTVLSGTTEARVVAVLAPGSAEALSWNAPEGGVMIDSTATGPILWRAPDEDLKLVARRLK
jgi:hypothetical protein